ncbi:MAG: family 20 glycosylhydrolase [Chitinophagaceae bacterium]|nr:family 20 glycosylhydrolase [Chitinophagaceae bacterium]
MKNYTILITMLFFAWCFKTNAGGLPNPFSIIPEPQSVQMNTGKGFNPQKLCTIHLQHETTLPVLSGHLSSLAVSESKGELLLQLDLSAGRFPSDEAYELRILHNRIIITAAAEAGLFYGCQSLEQLIEDAKRFNKALPALTIFDNPAMTFRAVHFDVKHHLDHMNYYYKSIDRLARYKINAVVFEFEDKLRYRRQPLVGASNAISIEEMNALTQYARKRNIEIIPLVQGLGHASFILKHEQYIPLRELSWNGWAFCPLNEGTYQVLFDMYRDAIEATPGSRYLHIGGDEIGNIGICERCTPFVKQHGMGALNLYWLKRVCAFAEANGRTPIFWDDMPLQEAGLYESTWNEKIEAKEADRIWKEKSPILDSLLPSFPKNCIYMRWNYGMATQPGNIQALDWYRSNHLQAMIATATNGEGGMLFQPDIRYKGFASAGNSCIKSFIELATEKDIKGMLCTAWDDKSPHMENFWPGFIAAAEYSWAPGKKSLEDLDQARAYKEFGIAIPQWQSLQKALRSGSEFWYEALFEHGSWMDDENMLQSLKQVEHWLKPLEGRENIKFDYGTKIIGLPDSANKGEWTNKYKAKLEKAALICNEYPTLMEQLKTLENRSAHNKYYWRLSAALCRFQTATPNLLLALRDMDEHGATGKTQLLADAIHEMKASFDNLCTVYSETRFVKQPPDFVKDRYFHTASQREDLSWMTQAQELFLEKIFGLYQTGE